MGLFQLFFITVFSKDLNGDEQHPDEDKRVFEIFDIVRDDCANYAGLIVQFFKLWAFYWNIKDFPSMSETYEQTLDDIKNWLEKKKNKIVRRDSYPVSRLFIYIQHIAS